MSSRERRLLTIIGLVYEGMDSEQMLPLLFTELRQLFGFSSGVLLTIDPGKLELQECFSFDCPAEGSKRYLAYYAPFDPYVCRDPNDIPVNQTVRLSDVAGYDKIGRSAFADFLDEVPYRHAVAAVVGLHGQPLAAFSVHRQKHELDFGSKEMAIVDQIAPHLGRAIALRNSLAKPAASVRVGLLAFGTSGEVLFINQTAQRLLAAASVEQVLAALPPGPGKLRLGMGSYRVSRVPWRAASLLSHFALQNSGSGALAGEHSTAERWNRVKALSAKLTIVALVPFRQRDDVRRRLARYGLSSREIQVAELSLHSRVSNAQLADRLQIGTETVKTHLHEIYGKIGVVNRMELLTTLLGLDGELPPC